MNELYNKSKLLGATDFGIPSRKTKRFFVVYNGKAIHFGSKNGSTFIDHHNTLLRRNWKARHSKIINKYGIPFYTIKSSPEYWSYHLLW